MLTRKLLDEYQDRFGEPPTLLALTEEHAERAIREALRTDLPVLNSCEDVNEWDI